MYRGWGLLDGPSDKLNPARSVGPRSGEAVGRESLLELVIAWLTGIVRGRLGRGRAKSMPRCQATFFFTSLANAQALKCSCVGMNVHRARVQWLRGFNQGRRSQGLNAIDPTAYPYMRYTTGSVVLCIVVPSEDK